MAVLTVQARGTLFWTLKVSSVLLLVWFATIMFRSSGNMTGNPAWLIFIAAMSLNLAAITVNPKVKTTRVATDK